MRAPPSRGFVIFWPVVATTAIFIAVNMAAGWTTPSARLILAAIGAIALLVWRLAPGQLIARAVGTSTFRSNLAVFGIILIAGAFFVG